MLITRKAVALVTLLAASTAVFTSTNVSAADANWADSIKLSGDIRYRFENTDVEGREDRGRSRIRARVKLDAQVNDEVKVGFRLASGGDNPISTNQTADKFATTKDFGVDRAFIAWTPVEGSKITAGKFSTPFYSSRNSQILWDGDLNPEGIAYNYQRNGFFANVARLNLDECSSCDDSYLNGVQAGYTYKMFNGNKVTVALGKFAYDLNATETGVADAYNETQLIANYDMKLNGRPLTFHASYVVNSDADELATAAGFADDLDTGIEFGFNYGRAKNPGDWELRYNYKKIDAFSLFPIWADSDFGGGGTDNDGHQFDFRYGFKKNFQVGLRYFINEIALSNADDADPATNPLDYNRVFLDFNFRF